MKKINNILVVVDDKDDRQVFIAEVATMAKDAEAKVTLLSVLDTPPDSHKNNEESSDLQQWLMEDQLEQMKIISSELEQKGIQVTIKQPCGKPSLEIIREAQRGAYDLIMKSAKSESAVKTLLFGGTDMQLFRLCPSPMWIFKPTQNTELKKIMIAVDLLAGNEEKSALADKVLKWGKHIANLVGSELHIVHVWDLYGETKLRGRSILANTVDKLVQDEEHKHRQWLNNALVKNGIERDTIQLHFYKGEANTLIPEVAKAMNIDLLVMGTVGRTGISGFFIGNTADAVLRQVDCSVLAIKPEGFLTPVEL